MEPFVHTSQGHSFWFLDPNQHVIDIRDIAHSLSNLCRYTGHCKRFYSVAEHSVNVSCIVPPSFALEGLLHDAAEAYLGDVSSPLKAQLPGYREIERGVDAAIRRRFCLPTELSPEVKVADLQMLSEESQQLMPYRITTADGLPPPLRMTPVCWGHSPGSAKALFLERYSQLTGAHVPA